MNQAFSLDTVIRQVTPGTLESFAEKLVIIDLAMKRAIPKKRIFHDAKYFLVANNSDGRRGAECTAPPIQVRDFSNDRTVAIKISYHANCDPGNEERVAESLFDGPHPGAVLNEKIKKYLTDYIDRRPAEFIDNYFAKRDDLQSLISSRVRQEVGLNLQVKLYLEGEQLLRPIPVGPFGLTVRVKDYDEDQKLNVRGELQVDEQNKINAVLHQSSDSALEDLVKRETRYHFAESVSLHKFCTELNDDVKQSLIKHLNRALKFAGRRIGFLSLESPATDNCGVAFFEYRQDVECRIQQYPTPVVIKNTVQMVIQNLARYRINKSPELGTWIKDKLERAVHELLFDTKYINLLLDFQPLEEKIKRRLSAEAESIGYGIKQLITVPDLEPLTWLKSFPIEIEDSFETRSPGVKVRLRIVVAARIDDLRKVRNYLNPGQNVPQLMKESIVRKMREFLHRVDPERFYMRFSFTEDTTEKPVQEELIKIVKTLLEEDFHTEVIDVTPKVMDTEYIEHLRELQKKIGEFAITISPVGYEDTETFVYKGKFRVEAVDANGWEKFRLLNSNIEPIRDHLQDSVRAKMETLSSDILAYRNYSELRSMEELIEKLARESIIEEFGLVIRIATIRREQTGLEKLAKRVKRDRLEKRLGVEEYLLTQEVTTEIERNQSIVNIIQKLENKRLKLADLEENEEEIASLEKQIKKHRRSLQSGLIAPKEKLEQLYVSGSSRRTSLQDFGMPQLLPADEMQGGEDEEAEK